MKTLTFCLVLTLSSSALAQQRFKIERVVTTHNRATDTVSYGRIFGVELNRVDSLPAQSEIILFLNNKAFPNYGVKEINRGKKTLFFMIDNRHGASDVTLAQFLGSDRTAVHPSVSLDIGTRGGEILTNPKAVSVEFIAGFRRVLAWVFGIGVAVIFLVLAARSELLKEAGRYSLARTQLAVWTAVIIILYMTFYLVSLSSPVVNTTVLALLGISVSNTVLAGTKPAVSKLVGGPGLKGFLIEILSDASGVSIHRFQHFLFTLVFVTIFAINSFDALEFAEFSTTQLTLMGISAAAFSGVKLINER